MFEIKTLLILIPAMPLAAAVLTAALGPRVLRGRSHLPTVAALAVSLAASLGLVLRVGEEAERERANEGWDQRSAGPSPSPPALLPKDEGSIRGGPALRWSHPTGFERIVTLWIWAGGDDTRQAPPQSPRSKTAATPRSEAPASERPFRVEIALRADPLTAVMLATVTLVSLLVAVYSIGYMHGDPGYWRFFSYIALFVFSMTMLVSVSNFALLYVLWEAVGLCSYLLIGFWYQKPEAAAAGNKAFLVNRVGDFGFALGVFLLWTTYGTLDFHDTVESAGILGQTRLAHPEMFATGGVATAICLLLMLGACGKSAQLPLHVWLPDAMEGPTPVSALIHAATMVTAGVYMVARCTPLFVASADAQTAMACIGAATALMAALIALTQTDLKRILAYSTISQLGYMFLGLGAGTLLGVTAGMFHLFTHAFFKALLFLGAGSVMHAMGGVIDVTRLGGLRRAMPWTHATMLLGCLALAGVFPFAGFWSKDLILVAVGERSGTLFWALGLAAAVTAFLTAFYTFRAFFLTFYGHQRAAADSGAHAHESPPSMTVPLAVLALAALVAGAWFELTHGFARFLARTPSLAFDRLAEHGPDAVAGSHLEAAILSTVLALAGIGLAALLYLGREAVLGRATRVMEALGLYGLSHGKFFVDPLYNVVVVWPLKGIARASYWIDRCLIDGAVDLCGLAPVALGAALRSLQNGLVPFYALAMVLGMVVLIGALMM